MTAPRVVKPATAGAAAAVTVEAPARLHFGMLDLRGSLGRVFGGIGAAAPAPSLLLEARPAPAGTLHAEGDDARRVEEFARRFFAFTGVRGGARLIVRRAIPAHSGLGSGTQLALSVARALAELYDVDASDTSRLARAVGRARRSAIGTWVFAQGGFILEGGRRRGGDAAAPLLTRLPFPPSWRCVIAVPRAAPGMSGDAESAAFASLPPPGHGEPEHVAHVVLMALLPALVEGDLTTFGEALSEVQRVNGRWFAAAQGGIFAPGPSEELVHQLSEWGAAGVGQSSWGPAVYGIVNGREAGEALAARVRAFLDATDGGDVYEGPFANEGARVTRMGEGAG
jgi:beta-RFAP synthase